MKRLTNVYAIKPFRNWLKAASFGQPRYSPSERAKRETQWMTDSLKLSPEQSAKVSEINLLYNNRLDKVTIIKNPQASAKKQESLMHMKDSKTKEILDRGQYQKYIVIESRLRKQQSGHKYGKRKPL